VEEEGEEEEGDPSQLCFIEVSTGISLKISSDDDAPIGISLEGSLESSVEDSLKCSAEYDIECSEECSKEHFIE
jgi:hypothetical protein